MSPLAMRTACSYTGLAGMVLKTSGFLGPMDLSDHFRKHGEDFSAATAQHYEFLADEFLSGSPGPRHHQCLRKHGDMLRFDCVTNEFGVLSSKGAFSNPRMILKRVWVGKGAGVGSDLLSRGQGRGGCEGAGGRSSGACSRSAATFLSMGLLSPRAAVSLRAQPGRREPGGRAKVPAARCPPTTASGSWPAVLSCAAASAAHTRCRSSGRLAAPEKQP